MWGLKTTIIRIMLTLFLIYGAYTETGKWTALNLFLIMFYIEAKTYRDRS